ncbi:MAG: lipid-A-disaccharide synthase [Candidatus Acidiferrales bacterium]
MSKAPIPALIVAGEASGDQHAAALAAELDRRAGVAWFGVGGDQMAAAGVELITHARELSVLGIFELLEHLPRLYRFERRLRAEILRRRPQFAVLVDLPGINLRLAAFLHRNGIPAVYFIAPQLWAWRPWRVRFLRRYVRKLLCIFPFEEEWFRHRGVEVEHVGHPLVDSARASMSREEFLRRHGLAAERPTVCLLPGSRHQEIERHLPAMLEAAATLAARSPVQFVLVEAATLDPARVDQLLAPLSGTPLRSAAGARHSLTVLRESPYNALAAADLAVVSSGTATVEGLLLGTPMVVVYRVAAPSWWAGKLLVRTPHYSMVNLIAGRRLVPELIQSEFTPQRLVAEMERLLSDKEARERIQTELKGLGQRLGPPGAIPRAARAVAAAVGLTGEFEDRG